jgi:hypothetical protein
MPEHPLLLVEDHEDGREALMLLGDRHCSAKPDTTAA